MCEHDRGFSAERMEAYQAACAEASASGALLVSGIEYADPEDNVHLPTWGPVPFLGEKRSTAAVLETVAGCGGASVIAHPRRHDAWRLIEPAWLERATGIEIWTRKWDGWAPNRWAVEQAWAKGLVGVVSLDLHQRGQMFPLGMQLQVAGAITPESCAEAFALGRARPLIGRVPVAPLTRGPLAAAARRVERLRRPVFRQGRAIRHRIAVLRSMS
jgi:hypothetical protein